MAIPADIYRDYPMLSQRCILAGYRGSIAHGMYVSPKEPIGVDDKDAMMVVVPPIDYYFGLREFGSRGTMEVKRYEWDIVIYEARKFVRLLAQGNPNVLCMLWLESQHYIKIKPAGRYLIEHRGVFVGRHVYQAFTGYAYGQLHRMTHMAFNGYMGEKRKALVGEFGYDTKNAAHLIRLLRMGIEFLKDGVLHVMRHDAQQLLEIKRGEWTLEQVKTEAAGLFHQSQEAYTTSSLPAKPNADEVNKVAVEVIKLAIEEH